MRPQRMHWKGSSGSGREHMREGLVVLHRMLAMTNRWKGGGALWMHKRTILENQSGEEEIFDNTKIKGDL